MRARRGRARDLPPRGEGDGVPGVRAPGHGGASASGRRSDDSDVGKTLVPVLDLADNGRRGSPIPRSERI